MADYKLTESGVIYRPTGLAIPADPLNRFWREYLAWLDAGNTPDPADQPTAEQIAREAEMSQAPLTARQYFASHPAAVAFARLTPQEQSDWIRTATLDQLRTLLEYLTIAACAVIKREYL